MCNGRHTPFTHPDGLCPAPYAAAPDEKSTSCPGRDQTGDESARLALAISVPGVGIILAVMSPSGRTSITRITTMPIFSLDLFVHVSRAQFPHCGPCGPCGQALRLRIGP